MALLFPAGYQFTNDSGNPLSAGTVTFYITNTTTLQAIYSDRALTTPITNPVVLNSAGRVATNVYCGNSSIYTILAKTSGGSVVFSRDDVTGWDSPGALTGEVTLTQNNDRGYSLARGAANYSMYIEDSDSSLRWYDIPNLKNFLKYTPNVGLSILPETNVTPTGAGTGQLMVRASGYNGWIALDGTAMYLGHNSPGRDLTLQTDETDRLKIDGTGLTTFLGPLFQGQAAQVLSGPGAVNLTTQVTYVATTGADALTLANGTQGQQKIIVMTTDGGTGTLTPANLGNGTTITFDDVGDTANLIFLASNWYWIGGTATLA